MEIKPKVARVVCEYLGLNPDDIHPEDEEYDGGIYCSFIGPCFGLGHFSVECVVQALP